MQRNNKPSHHHQVEVSYTFSRKLSRRSSTVILTSLRDKKEIQFKSSKEVIYTHKNQVRKFVSPLDTRVLAVKSPLKDLSNNSMSCEDFEKECNKIINILLSEGKFFRAVYPEAICGVFADVMQAEAVTRMSDCLKKKFTYRLVMTFFDGESLDVIFAAIKSENNLLELILAVMLEIKRMHEIGVIHGDLNSYNLLASLDDQFNWKVNIVDFQSAYLIKGDDITFTDVSDECAEKWAPERRVVGDKISDDIVPDVKQDIYSLGYMLNELTEMTSNCFAGKFNTYCPGLFSLIKKATNTLPKDRPELTEMIEATKNEIKKFKM